MCRLRNWNPRYAVTVVSNTSKVKVVRGSCLILTCLVLFYLAVCLVSPTTRVRKTIFLQYLVAAPWSALFRRWSLVFLISSLLVFSCLVLVYRLSLRVGVGVRVGQSKEGGGGGGQW